jgi:PhnB protein
MERAAEAAIPFQQIYPYLLYEDALAAVEWLSRTFRAREVGPRREREGRVVHAEIDIAGATVFVGTPPSGSYQPPRARGGPTAFVYLYVEDVDAHFESTSAAGAEIIEPPADHDYGDRRYGAVDLDGHWWFFAQRLR